jgi:ribA/ribD-fused uncharacterized protein
VTYRSSEHAYQAAKSADPEERAKIAAAKNPRDAKRMGTKVTLIKDWGRSRIYVMTQIVLAKFEQNPDLQQKLIATYPADLIEGNYWGDRFWGVSEGFGSNHLGKILMGVRDILRLPRSTNKTYECLKLYGELIHEEDV